MKPIQIVIGVFAIVSAAILFVGCGSSKTVSRVEPTTTIDLNGDWNDTDSRLVAEEMIKDVLSRPWLGTYTTAKSKNPNVIVGTVKNRTS